MISSILSFAVELFSARENRDETMSTRLSNRMPFSTHKNRFARVLSLVTSSSVLQLEGVCELNTLTSKNALLLLLSQKFWAFTSNLAPSSLFVLLWGKVFPVSGCRPGSMATLGQTSVRNCASKSLMRLCWIDGIAPLEQLSGWLRLTVSPHASVREVSQAATHTSHIKHPKMPVCGGWIIKLSVSSENF